MENELVSLRQKLHSKNNKQNFDNSTKILDQIISSQWSAYDKSGLGYNQNDVEMGSISKMIENDKRSYVKTVKESIKKEDCEPLKGDMQKVEMKKNEENECAWKNSSTTHNNDLRRYALAKRPPIPRYHFFFPWLVLCLQ